MKYLFSSFLVLAFILSGCVPAMESPPEDSSIEAATAVSLQEISSSATNSTKDGQAIKIEVVGGDDASLREFIKQWLTPVYPDGSSGDMTVYIGSTPKDIPYDLPVPEDARTIGGITGGWVDYQLLFDTGLDSKATQEFYAKNLIDKGWQEAPTPQGQGGFVSQSDLYQIYCQKDGKAYLNVETPPVSDSKTGIRLTLDTTPDAYMCNGNAATSGYSPQNLIPQLKAPKGALVQGSGAGSSDRDAEVSASIKSDMSPADLVEYYNEQLLAAGWKMQTSSSGDGAAWSNWTLTDEQGNNWLGSLIVIQTSPNRDSRYALVRIEKDL